jgi:hypothetical protein
MLRVKRIVEVEALKYQATTPPRVILSAVETAAERAEPWWVVQAISDRQEDALWLAVFPDAKEALFFTGEETLKGRWDEGRCVFFDEEGKSWNLEGRQVSVSSMEEEAAEEDAGYEEEMAERRRRQSGKDLGPGKGFL